MLTAAHDSSIRQVGTQRWLHKLNSQRQHRQHFSTLQAVDGLRAVSVGRGAEPLLRYHSIDFHAPPCKRWWRLLAAQLQADRMRAVR